VAILAALAIVTGIFSLCGGFASIFSFGVGVFGSLLGIGEPGGLGAGIYGLVWGAITILFGYGLWNLRPWARLGTILLQAINLFYAVLALFTPPHVPWISAIIAVGILYYLTRPNVKDSFA
jgi:hypothetical protein